MIKKVKKYLKFIVCCALILSLIAPSYAGLSASDGSAFVTKAEFDAALADFNTRLTTFEAGINSKIDSQVTSYLDRNGIWNGKDQQAKWSDGGAYVAFPHSFDAWMKTGFLREKSGTTGTFKCGGTPDDWIVCNKSGLCVFSLSQTEGGSFYYYKQDDWSHSPTWSVWIWTISVEDSVTGSKLGTLILWGGAGSQTTRGNAFSSNQCYNEVFMGFSPITTVLLFFVKNGQKIRLSEYLGHFSNTFTLQSGGGEKAKYVANSVSIY